MYGINDYLDACEHRESFLNEQHQWMSREKRLHYEEVDKLEAVLDRTRHEIAGYLIPEITDEHIDELQSRLSCHGLIEIKRGFEKEFVLVEQRTEELEGMDEIQEFDELIQSANHNVELIRPEYDRLNNAMDHWFRSRWFPGLEKRGYFEPKYQAGLFRRFFDWRAVSLLMSDLEKNAGLTFDSPEPLKSHFRELRAETEKVSAEFDKRASEADRIQALYDEYQELLLRPEQLLAELYQALGDRVIEHLETCPNEMRMRLVANDSELNKFLQRDIGIRKQIQYLKEITVTRLDSRLEETHFEIQKTQNKMQKLRFQRMRGKRKYYTEDDIARMRNVKAEKWERRRLKTEKLRQRIAEFDRYDDGSCEEDYLWWDIMTKRARGDDIFEVRDHRQRHPDWDYREHRDAFEPQTEEPQWDDAADDLAASMVASDDDLFDPS